MATTPQTAPDDPFPQGGDHNTYREWCVRQLKGRPREDCIIVASRLALRVFANYNFVSVKKANFKKTSVLFIRGYLLSHAASLASDSDKWSFVVAASAYTSALANFAAGSHSNSTTVANRDAHSSGYAAIAGIEAAKSIVNTAIIIVSAGVAEVAFAAFNSSYYAGDTSNHTILYANALTSNSAFEADLARLDGSHAAREGLAASPLWLNEGGAPQEILDNWNTFSAQLRALGDNWDVWAEWYGGGVHEGKRFPGVLQGAKNGQYLFGLSTARALKLWHDLALLPNDLWQGEPAALNAEFKRLVEEARGEGEEKQSKDVPPPKSEKPKAAPKAKPAPKPKTALGKAVLANAGVLALQIELMFPLIDREIERLTAELPNSDEAIAKRNAEIAFLNQIKANASALKQAVLDYPEEKMSEAALQKTTNAFFKPFQECWEEKGAEFVEVGIRSGLFLGAMAIAPYCGVPALAATLVIGAITAGKPLAEVLKAAKGVLKFT